MKFTDSSSPFAIAKKKFIANPVGMVALAFVVLVSIVAVFAYWIVADYTPNANRQILEISTQKPGFACQFLIVPKVGHQTRDGIANRALYGRDDEVTFYPLTSYRFTTDSMYITIFESESEIEPIEQGFLLHELMPDGNKKSKYMIADDSKIIRAQIIENQIVTKSFLLGTDQFGRDLLSRLLIGSRISLAVGFISVFISLLVGVFFGSIAGYYRGRTDDMIVWFINVVWSVPTLLMVIAITFALGKGFWQVFVAVGLTMWVEVARVVRGQILSIREKEFVEAAKSLGYSDFRIILRHILPNVMSSVIVISAANFASAILIEAGLSFLGLGIQPPMPSWGGMLKENYAFILLDAAYLALLPGFAIMLLVLAFMLIGNALRDALDVKLVD
ncbi:MAG: ABC transporter permease [Bacteroidales bacterium]|nr:ABC transporter permease [Bacteroidales bacterium]